MNRVVLDKQNSLGTISKNLYGNFSEHLGRCVYQGIFVGKDSPIPNVNGMRTDVVEALKKMKLPVLRWPGGCFADEYHWQDGIGPQKSRKRMVNTNWGGVVEDNSFGTHEFMEFCRQVGCEPYINGNVGSGTVREMAEWVEYLNSAGDSTVAQQRWANGHKEPFGVKFWGVGNENWGCGGNMRAEYYVHEYRRYQTFCKNYAPYKLFRIACGPSEGDTHWTEVMMQGAWRDMEGLSMHYYTVPGDWGHKGKAIDFTKEEYDTTLVKAARIEELIKAHLAVMDRFDKEHRVGLIVDEWGTWYDVEEGTNPGFLYQQNTMRDAMVAALTLNIFNNHCDRVVMANIAQMVNVLQAVILTEGDKMVLTPTYHVFEMYKEHQDAWQIAADVLCEKTADGKLSRITASASEKDGAVTVTVANLDGENDADVRLEMDGIQASAISGRILHGNSTNAHNDFDHPDTVAPAVYTDFAQEGEDCVKLHLPACSVAVLTIKA